MPVSTIGRYLVALAFAASLCPAQWAPSGAAEIDQRLRRLNSMGRVLMIAAHPDDENTNLLAYFARGRHYRTGYLSLTRGEGGQNLIGPEQGDEMGLIRTQELLAARRIDGAEQYFTRAIDFGFSKNAGETLAKWGREAVLDDAVRVIRRFRPDVIIFRFSGTPRDGHGHHQSSAILGKEAFAAAADPMRFSSQGLKAWKAKRALFNLFAFNEQMERENAKVPGTVVLDTGGFDPVLGFSYGEIAGMSRSRHASQAMGAAERKGVIRNQLVVVAGEPASGDPFAGIETSWKRLPGGNMVDAVLAEAIGAFNAAHPERLVPLLFKARAAAAAIPHEDAREKLGEFDELIALAAGVWVDAAAQQHFYTPAAKARITLTAVNRLGLDVTLLHEGEQKLEANVPWTRNITWEIPADAALSQPYWLRQPKQGALYGVAESARTPDAENAPEKTVTFRLKIQGEEVVLTRPVLHRYVDPARGELRRAVVIGPPVAVEFSESAILFPDTAARTVQLQVRAMKPGLAGEVALEAPAGWKISPAAQPFKLEEAGEQTAMRFQITPPAADSSVTLRAVVNGGGHAVRVISYPHIPPQTVFPPAEVKLVRTAIRTLSRKVGYVMGAGDEVPQALRQLGIEVTLLSDADLAASDLSRFDAIVTGVRAYNTRPALKANHQRLLDYMTAGGTWVVQYNVVEGFPGRERRDTISRTGPYPITLGRGRITVEEAPVRFPNPDHVLLRAPNRITMKDFEGWVQERGLYFASEYDAQYEAVVASQDPGEDWLPGGMLYARYGAGAYVFSAYAWFRQLPAGVPGAYRIFANLLSAGKAK
ncbi:MAG: PIG-L family deacetylase [Bryobacteraceae bacterium]|nr:PIG-L family deacetylase [Bryobacteraceae bacterium]